MLEWNEINLNIKIEMGPMGFYLPNNLRLSNIIQNDITLILNHLTKSNINKNSVTEDAMFNLIDIVIKA